MTCSATLTTLDPAQARCTFGDRPDQFLDLVNRALRGLLKELTSATIIMTICSASSATSTLDPAQTTCTLGSRPHWLMHQQLNSRLPMILYQKRVKHCVQQCVKDCPTTFFAVSAYELNNGVHSLAYDWETMMHYEIWEYC